MLIEADTLDDLELILDAALEVHPELDVIVGTWDPIFAYIEVRCSALHSYTGRFSFLPYSAVWSGSCTGRSTIGGRIPQRYEYSAPSSQS